MAPSCPALSVVTELITDDPCEKRERRGSVNLTTDGFGGH